jgi:hypothetical protein
LADPALLLRGSNRLIALEDTPKAIVAEADGKRIESVAVHFRFPEVKVMDGIQDIRRVWCD